MRSLVSAKRLSLTAALVFAILFAPVVGFANIRQAYLNELALKRAAWIHPSVAMVGDSLTAAGTPWGVKLHRDPFSVVTKARGGFASAQLRPFLEQAIALRPKVIVITAGTNDVGSRYYDQSESVQDLMGMVHTAKASGARVIATLPLPPVDKARAAATRKLADAYAVELEAEHVEYIDLWPSLAPAGHLIPELSTDGIHFKPPAYAIWSAQLRDALARRP